jgi:Mn2+/Fe2+ NRAMP family transporter
MLYGAAIINGIVAVPVMIMMLMIANNKNIMGQYTSGIISNALATTITIIMTTAAIAMMVL